jgi:2-dehydro-3-deoxyphosphogluconate aldolase/(4S)-4-hydroxy-2-oxoglutarate aldolase
MTIEKPGSGTLVKDVLGRMEKARIVPIVVIEDPSKVVPLGKAILDGGLDLVEITMRTPKAMEAVRLASKELPEMLVGAGTVFSVTAAKEALSAGAQFIVSPHLDEDIVAYCAERNVVSIPGVFTPSEVQRAIEAASRGTPPRSIRDLPLVAKIFPASTGGPGHIAAMRAVFPDVRFLPLGGVNAGNLAEYIKAGAWAVGGTWLCKRELIETGNFSKISELIKEALRVIASTKR